MYIHYNYFGKYKISCSPGMGLCTPFRSYCVFMVPGTVDPLSNWHYDEDLWWKNR